MRELDEAALERRLREVLDEHLGALPLDLTVDALDRRREARRIARRFRRGRGITLLAAAAVLLVGGALAAGSGVLRLPSVVPPVPAPSFVAIVDASPEAPSSSPSDSASPTAVPTPTPTPIVWTEASLEQDWPAPVRTEPTGGASVAPMPPTYIDPSGDAGSDAVSYVDITDVRAGQNGLSFDLGSKPPDVDPSQAWIAYGVVMDTNGDGVPDWRYGMDNLPPTTAKAAHRAWRTNLHTGQTEFNLGPLTNGWGGRGDPLDEVGATRFGTGYPAGAEGAGPRFSFYATGDVTGGGSFKIGAKQTKPFYVWASAIVDGRVVATDYAPDTGWLIPTPDNANPGGTYATGVDDRVRLTMNVPDGWTTAGPDVFPNTGEARLHFLIADHPAEWACDASAHAIKPPVGPTVDDLVTFLAYQPMLKISENTDVTLDRYRGKYLEYTTSYDGNDNCQPPEWPFSNSGTAALHQVWILDVDGVRLVIDASAPKASDPVTAEFRRIVDTVAFESTGLEPTPTPTPEPTAIPTPTPTPFPPTAGPVPQGARSWEVTVENKSSKPATLFLAREPLNDMGQLCGSVTPDVVPAGVTQKVTFLLPRKSVNDCWLMIRPGPGADGAFGPTDNWPTPGKLIISDGGDNANGDDPSTVWQGP